MENWSESDPDECHKLLSSQRVTYFTEPSDGARGESPSMTSINHLCFNLQRPSRPSFVTEGRPAHAAVRPGHNSATRSITADSRSLWYHVLSPMRWVQELYWTCAGRGRSRIDVKRSRSIRWSHGLNSQYSGGALTCSVLGNSSLN